MSSYKVVQQGSKALTSDLRVNCHHYYLAALKSRLYRIPNIEAIPVGWEPQLCLLSAHLPRVGCHPTIIMNTDLSTYTDFVIEPDQF